MPVSYSSQSPYSVISHSILSQDVISASTILVSSSSNNPIGAFPNPSTGNIEALFVSDAGTLSHATRSSTGETGWAVTPLTIAAAEAAAGTAFANSSSPATYGFYHDNTNTYYLTFDGSWSTQGTVLGPAINNMKLTYAADGMLVVYGTSGSTLYAYTADAFGNFTTTTWNIAPSADVRLIAYSGDGVPSLQAAWIGNGALVTAQGTVGSSQPATTGTAPGTSGATQVVHGFWSSKNAVVFLYFAGGDLWMMGGTSAIQNGGPAIATATGFQRQESDGSQTLHIYAVDNLNTLWVLHQDRTNPWSQSGAPNFTQFIPLDAAVSNVVADMNPADAPTLFAINQGAVPNLANGLRLHAQDPNSGYWWCDNMYVPATSQQPPFEVRRFRTEVTVLDANGAPAANVPVTLQVAAGQSGVNVAVGQNTYGVSSSVSASVTTDGYGKVTFSVMANNGIATPQIVVTAAGNTLPVEASLPVHNYLAGNGTLNPTNPDGGRQAFDSGGTTLGTMPNITQPANVPAVASALQQIGQLALQHSGTPPPAASTAAVQSRRAIPMAAMSFGSWLDDVAGDVVHAVESGVMHLADDIETAVQIVGNAIQLSIKELGQAITVGVNAIEDAAHAIAAAVMYVVDKVEDFIDWLKAIFNLGAIINTAIVFSNTFQQLPGYVTNTLVKQATAATTWLDNQKATIHSYFASYTPGQSFNQTSPQYQSGTGGPSSSAPAGSSVAPSDCVHNVHHNFMQDKVQSAGTSAPSSGLSDPWSAFGTDISSALSEFESAFATFATAIEDFFTNIDGFSVDTFVSTFAENLIDALIDLAKAVVAGLAGLAEDAMNGLMTMMNQQIENDFLQTIWNWVVGDKMSFTIGNVISLLVAFPVTILYTLINGNPPYPSTESAKRAMAMVLANDPSAGLTVTTNYQLGGLLEILSWVPAMMSLAAGAAAPWILTFTTLLMGGVAFYLKGGTATLGSVDWTAVDSAALGVLCLGTLAFCVIQTGGLFASMTSRDWVRVAFTGLGGLVLTFGIIGAAKKTVDETQSASNILLALPRLFAFLQTSYFTGNEVAAGFSALIITAGYMGGGFTDMAAGVNG